MSAGIYVIKFNTTDKVYVGHSSLIQDRWQRHLRELNKNIHHSKKLQEYYNLVDSNPVFEVITYLSSYEDRLKEEALIISELDAYNNGFNMTAGGEVVGAGHQHTAAKYSKEDYIEVFKLLAYTNLSLPNISLETGVSRNIVANISSGRRHAWLHTEYDLEWLMIQNKSRINLSKDRDSIISAFKFLVGNVECTKEFIQNKFNISKKQVEHLIYGTGYTWLKEMYPIEYSNMQSRINRYKK